ncbi:peptidase T [Peptoniphilus sp.]|uniref:peptidase T n=1 Tax=Peptoniphilus sp. TaxID=1971214 RepID=UPI0039964933
MDITERFLNYVKFDTQSDAKSKTVPSTEGQMVFAKYLEKELNDIGVRTDLDDKGYLFGYIPSNVDFDLPKVGFLAHLDTAPDFSGKNVNPQIIEYKGGDIKLLDGSIMSPDEFPGLNDVVGEEIIVTDGTTLLGADDKSGITIIMDAIEKIVNDNTIKHGEIRVGFTPDEEIGRGPHHFDVERFDCDFAFTVDGGKIGELQYENFNACSCFIEIEGKSVHPGSAKNIMINALDIATELNESLPVQMRPQFTENYEGFFMLSSMNGGVSHASMEYIIRDHDMDKFNEKKNIMKLLVSFLEEKHQTKINLEFEDSYFNMKEKLLPHMDKIMLAKKSMEEVGIEPIIEPIRGGSDGSQLSYMGLPCPNFFAGGYNFHGKYEFIPISSIVKGSELVVRIIENLVEENK